MTMDAGLGPTQEQGLRELRAELEAEKERARRRHLLVVTTLVAVAMAAFGALSFVGYSGFRVARQMSEVDASLESSKLKRAATERELTSELIRHRRELSRLQKATQLEQGEVERSQRELHETYTRVQRVLSEQQDRLDAMRENNSRLQTELEQLNTQLQSLPSRPDSPPSSGEAPSKASRSRFVLGETALLESSDERRLFESASTIRRASSAMVPAHIAIELSPLEDDELRVGVEYELRVHLVNRSRRVLRVESLDLSWVLGERRTGGVLDVAPASIEPKSRTLVYAVKGEWSPLQDRGGASLEATVWLAAGEALKNVLTW